MMKIQRLMIAAVLFAFSVSFFGQITPDEAVAQMGLGINLGNTLEPPHEGEWNNPPAEDYYFADFADAGFKTLRLPVKWDLHTSYTSPYNIDTAWINRVEHLVDLALDEDLFVIINAHHEDWLKVNYTADNIARFDSIWSQIAERFKDKSEKLFFEIINEPRTQTDEGLTQSEIDALNVRILGIIRKTNPTRIVIYSGKGWTSSYDMMTAAIPDDDYIMAYYHSYDPWSFAGDGNGTWGSTSQVNTLENQFKQIKSWSDENDINVLLGEWGAVRSCDFNSRMKHYFYYIRFAVENGFANAVWDDGGQFGIYNRAERTWDFPKDIIIHSHESGPANFSISFNDDSTAIELSWTNISTHQDSIYVQRIIGDTTFTNYALLPGDAISYSDTSISETGFYTYRIIAHYIDSIDYYSYPQRLQKIPSERFLYNGEPFTIPGTVEAEEYDIGGEGLTYHDSEEDNIPGAFRPDEGVDIEAKDIGGYQIAYIDAGEWIEYTIDVAEDTFYMITAYVATQQSGKSFRISFKNGTTDNFNVPNTGSWQVDDTVTLSFKLEAGIQRMRVEMISGPFNLNKLVFEVDPSPPVSENINSDNLLSGLRIYPNPVGNELFIQFEEDMIGLAKIYNINGVLKYHNLIKGNSSINIENYKTGFYILKIQFEDKIYITKFLKQ